MKTKTHSSLVIRHSLFISVGTVFVAAITLFTATARVPAQSVWGNALSFNGTNDWVQAGAVPLANSSFTVEAWVQRRSSNTVDMVVSQGSGGYNHCLMFGFHYYAGNQFVFDFYGNGVESGTADTDSAWHHWAGTYDASSKIRCLYRDGVLMASNTNTAEDYQGSGPLKIGVGPSGEAPNEFDGQIDDVRIWNVALSQAQIAAQMTQPLSGKEPNLLAYWKFDEGSGTNVFDATTNHFDGIFKSSPEWVASTAPWEYALSLNQSTDYVLTTIPVLASNYTVSAWTYLRGGGNNAGGDNVVGLLSGSSVEVMLHSVTSAYTDPQYLELGQSGVFGGTLSTGTVPLNQWVHVAVTVSSNKQVSYFVNGLPAGTWNASAWGLTIGPIITLGDNTSRRFNGMLDEVQIWKVALSQAQIAAQMTHPLSGDEPNLLAYWKFDEDTGTVAFDATTNHCDGTLVNNPAWVVSTVTLPPPFTYDTNNDTITITGYNGPGWDVTIPDTINDLPVTSIGNYAFFNCTSLTFIAIPHSVTSIGDEAFESCYSLTSVTIGNSVTNIGNYAFADCEILTDVSIPASVINMGELPFIYCPSLAAITVETNNPVYASVAGVLINKSQTTLVECPAGKTGSYIVPAGITSIGDYAFEACESLTNITIPDSVTSIGNEAFEGCNSLPSITIPDSVTSIGSYAFAGCTSLTGATIGNRVTSLGDNAFGTCTKLTGIYFTGNAPNLVGSHVFYLATNATVYYVPGTTGLDPQVQTSDANFGVRTNRFGFTIAGVSGLGVVVQACTNLANPTWSSVANLNFTGSSAYFSDPEWTNYRARFYRLGNPTFGGRPVLLWNARAQTGDASFGVRSNRFGFTVTGTPDIPIVVEACTGLASGAWTPLQTCTVTNGSLYFSDAQWTNYTTRFYRVRWP